MTIFDFCLIAWFAYGLLLVVSGVGKPRKPITSKTAAWATVITSAWIVGLLVSRGVFA